MLYHKVRDEIDEEIWSTLLAHAGETFTTERGLPFTYRQKLSLTGKPRGELVFDRKEKTVTRNTILLAYERAQELMETNGFVSGPKELGVFGASYLFAVFLKLGICKKCSVKRKRRRSRRKAPEPSATHLQGDDQSQETRLSEGEDTSRSQPRRQEALLFPLA